MLDRAEAIKQEVDQLVSAQLNREKKLNEELADKEQHNKVLKERNRQQLGELNDSTIQIRSLKARNSGIWVIASILGFLFGILAFGIVLIWGGAI